MKHPTSTIRPPLWLAAVMCLCAVANQVHAEASSSSTEPTTAQDGPLLIKADNTLGDTWTPRQSSRHVGVRIGAARFNTPCIDGMVCKRSGKAITLYAGGDLSQRWGFELAYMRMSNMQKDGNALRLKGLNVNLIGELPFASVWKLTGRVGTNYAWTRMDLGPNAAEPTGSARGLGLSYGTSLSVDFAEHWTASADLNRHSVKFVTGRDAVDTAALSLRYRY